MKSRVVRSAQRDNGGAALLDFRAFFGYIPKTMSAPAPLLAPLRAQLESVIVGGRVTGTPWPTGMPAVDAALGGGIPRGRITELTGPLAVGKTALLRQVVARVLHSGGWVAWIDARRTLAPAPWADVGERFVVIRPPDQKRSAWTADLLLRSGVFALVVIDGAPALSRVHGVRLGQLARERDAACVVLTHVVSGEVPSSRLAGTVRVRVALAPPPTLQQHAAWAAPGARQRRVARGNAPSATSTSGTSASTSTSGTAMQVIVEKGGQATGTRNNTKALEVDRVVVVARRVCADTEIPDRRGVARSARRPWTARGNSSDTEQGQPPQEHPVTWGGLGVADHDLYGTDVPGHPARLAAGLDDAPSDRLGGRLADERHTRELDRLTRDWATYRGRRRAAESGYGRRSRRDAARERSGALLASHRGQSRGSNGSPRLGRDTASEGEPAASPRDRPTRPAPLG
jgi:recombination protein RecA